jgi:hypothetical protein
MGRGDNYDKYSHIKMANIAIILKEEKMFHF